MSFSAASAELFVRLKRLLGDGKARRLVKAGIENYTIEGTKYFMPFSDLVVLM